MVLRGALTAAGALVLTTVAACGGAAASGGASATPTAPSSLSATATSAAELQPSTLVLSAPSKVVDEHRVTVSVTWTSPDGDPVAAAAVTLTRSTSKSGADAKHVTVTTDASGKATLTAEPRVDTWWRAVGEETTTPAGTVPAASSKTVKIDNVPPRAPVKLPSAAPKPQHLPAQPRAVGSGANAKVTRISNAMWQKMDGITWRSGCPVGRSDLRVMGINYWGFDGYRHRGQMVAAASAMKAIVSSFTALYNHHYPIRSMRPVDYFGYSKKDSGGDDDASMAHDNTSAFNCRWVGGVPGRVSNHALGIAIDINTWENPYQSPTGPEPDGWWLGHSQKNLTFRSSSDPVVRLLAQHGLHWVLGMDDTQHFEVR